MFRCATALLAKAAPKAAPRTTHVAVSPYALFLMETSNHQALTGLSIASRADAAGKLWNSLEREHKVAFALKALKAEPFFVHKGLPRRPPPFARYVKKYWAAAPKDLSFEDKVVLLAERFQKGLKKRSAAAAKKTAKAAAVASQ